MNSDHVNYQQNIARSVNEEKDYDNAPKQQPQTPLSSVPSSETLDKLVPSPTTNNGDHPAQQIDDEKMNLLSPSDRHERILTLLVMAYISLLTGIDYAIILPTAWGYINTFMHAHYGGLVMGILLSVFALSGAISGIILGYLNDKGVPAKRLVLFAIMFKIVGNLLYFIGINIYFLILSRMIAGIGLGLVPPLLAEISKRSTIHNRTQLLSKILACRQIGLLLGPCFTILMKEMNFKLFGIHVTMHNAPGLLMAGLWVIATILTVFFFFDLPPTNNQHNGNNSSANDRTFRQALGQTFAICKKPVVLVLLVTSFIAYFNQTALETTLTPFTARQFNWHELQVSILFAVAGVEITLVYVGLNYATKQFKDRCILLFGFISLLIACLIAVLILPFSKVGSTRFLPAFLLFVALDILALPLIVVTSTSLYTKHMASEDQGLGQGVQRFIISMATVVGPLYAGALMKHTWTMLFSMWIVVVISTGLILVVYRSFKSKYGDESEALIQTRTSN